MRYEIRSNDVSCQHDGLTPSETRAVCPLCFMYIPTKDELSKAAKELADYIDAKVLEQAFTVWRTP